MNNTKNIDDTIIANWLANVPDHVAICDNQYQLICSNQLLKLNLEQQNLDFIKLQIQGHDFDSETHFKILDFKISERFYQIDIEKFEVTKVSYFYCKFIDRTDFENLSKEIQQSRAQQINIARLTELAELAGGISHEISNPLTIVMAKVSFLQTKLANIDLGMDKEKIKEALDKIIHHSNRITKIIKGLKNFSRSDDKETLIRSDLKDLLDEAFLLTIESIKIKGIFIDTSGFDGRYLILCHPVQIVQVFVNLLKNACDALEHTRQPVIKIGTELSGENVKIYFEDNGPGVPEEVQSKIFNPFFTTKPTGKGTGLGLSLSHHIIHRHDGKLFLDLNKGPSCFCIELRTNQI